MGVPGGRPFIGGEEETAEWCIPTRALHSVVGSGTGIEAVQRTSSMNRQTHEEMETIHCRTVL